MSSLMSSMLSSMFQSNGEDDSTNEVVFVSPPPFKLFFSDDGGAVLAPAEMRSASPPRSPPPPPPLPFFSQFFSQGGPSFLRGGGMQGGPVWEMVSEDEEAQEEESMEEHPCMHMVPADDAESAEEEACARDTLTLCEEYLSTDADDVGAAFQQQLCLMRHGDELSNNCRSFMAAQDDSLVSMCHKEIDKHCSDVSPGNHRVHNCLWAARPQLSSGCRAQLQKSRPHVTQSITATEDPIASEASPEASSEESPETSPEAPSVEEATATMQKGMGDLGRIFNVLEDLLGDDNKKPDANPPNPPMMGSDPSTWAPKKTVAHPPNLGGDPATWAPENKQQQKHLSSEEAELKAAVEMSEEEKTAAPLRARAVGKAGPAAAGGGGAAAAAARDWAKGKRPIPLEGRRIEDIHWGGGSGGDVQVASSAAPMARLAAAASAASPSSTSSSAPAITFAQPLAPASETGETSGEATWGGKVLAAATAAAGCVAFVALAAVANQASRRRQKNAAQAEWSRSFAPALLA